MHFSLFNKIKTYSALAGVAALALPVADADAQIIYTNVQPDEVLGKNAWFEIDLNGDGKVDFEINRYFYSTSYTSAQFDDIIPMGTAAILGKSNNATLLKKGDTISSKASWNKNGFSADFTLTHNSYLGLRFANKGNTYYGWVRLNVGSSNKIKVLDFAYNSVPGQPILAGDSICAGNPSPVISQNANLLQVTGNGRVQWQLNGVLQPAYNDSMSLHTPPAGFYNAIFTDTLGCHTAAQTILRYLPCDSVKAVIKATSDSIICYGYRANFAYSYPSQNFTFQWLVNDIPSTDYYANDSIFSAKTDSNVSLIVSYHGCIDTSNTIRILSWPYSPPPLITQRNDTLFAPPGYYIYQWDYIKGTSSTTVGHQYFYKPLKSGTYRVAALDGHLCAHFSDNYNFISTGLNDAPLKENVIYTSQYKQLHLFNLPPEWLGAQLKIVDLTGRIIYTGTAENSYVEVNLSNHASGVYLFELKNKNRMLRQKFVLD